MKQYMRNILIAGLMLWILLFSIDSMFGIDWPSYTIHRIFIWCPTVLIGLYWLLFGGTETEKDK